MADQAMQALAGDQAIDYVVMTKNDGYSIVIDRSTWKVETLGEAWHPTTRMPTSSIGVSPLFGRRVYQYAFPFDYSGIQWGWIHIGLSLDAYDEGVRRTYKRTGALTLLCGGLSLVISLAYAARLVRPIHTLHAAVEKVARGDLHARAEVSSGDEIERLAEAFNDMAQTILARNQILESVSFAARRFLSDGDRDTIVGQVMERVGQAAGVNRACVLKISTQENYLRSTLQQEWLLSGTPLRREGWEDFPWQMDGFQLAERIRRNPKLTGAIVLMLTSGGQPGDIDRCRELGISAYLIKPIRRSELLDVVLRVLNKAPKEVITDREDPFLPNAAARKLCFLAAEDNLVNQRLIARLLESAGHAVTVVGDGLAAVNASQKDRYDTILMDVQMPIMDGHEATRQIRRLEQATGAHVPIIAMTAHALNGDRDKCLDAGMDDYIAKPLHKQELLQAIYQQTAPNRVPVEKFPAPALAPISLDDELDIEGAVRQMGGDEDLFANFAASSSRIVRL